MDKIKGKLTLDCLIRLITASGKYLKYRRIFIEFIDTFYIDFKNGLLEAEKGNRWNFYVEKQPVDGIYIQ